MFHAGPKHLGACPGHSGIQAPRFKMLPADKPATPLVVRDADGEAWINLGNGNWAQVGEVARGKKYAEAWPNTWTEMEQDFGPLTVEWSLPR